MSKVLPDTSLSWYETTLPLWERKQRGHFSTPAPLVERILDACGYTPLHGLAALRVLDPACGSGNFLLAAARRLLAFGERAGYTREACEALVQSNIWGLDPDPISCFLSEMHLNDVIRRELSFEVGTTPGYVDVEAQLIASLHLHIHQSDALALPWEPCVDLFLANPPYLAAKNIDLSGYRFAQKHGQMDSYLLFLSLGMQVVRPNGWLGLVLPDPLLARANAAGERAQLLRDFTIHHLWHLAGTFAAQVGAVVIIAQKTPPKSTHYVACIREKWNDAGKTQDIPQAHFSRQPRAEFRYLSGNTHDATLDRLCQLHESGPALDVEHTMRRIVPLGDLLTIQRGEELGRKSQYLIPLGLIPISPTPTRGVTTCSRTCSDTPCGCQDLYPLLRGGIDIRPYTEPIGEWSIAREHIAKPIDRYLAPKLLVVKSTAQLQAALDLRGHVVLQTLYMLQLKENYVACNDNAQDDLYFFLALLNSRLLREYVYVQYTAYKWVQPQIEQHVLANLPAPLVTCEQKQEIIELAKQLVKLCSCSQPRTVVEWDEMRTAYAEQERAIRALYDASLQ
jgi:SAM-dependent methyltransferase